jgi:hypothetical protein
VRACFAARDQVAPLVRDNPCGNLDHLHANHCIIGSLRRFTDAPVQSLQTIDAMAECYLGRSNG